jgi:hypothetical protein
MERIPNNLAKREKLSPTQPFPADFETAQTYPSMVSNLTFIDRKRGEISYGVVESSISPISLESIRLNKAGGISLDSRVLSPLEKQILTENHSIYHWEIFNSSTDEWLIEKLGRANAVKDLILTSYISDGNVALHYIKSVDPNVENLEINGNINFSEEQMFQLRNLLPRFKNLKYLTLPLNGKQLLQLVPILNAMPNFEGISIREVNADIKRVLNTRGFRLELEYSSSTQEWPLNYFCKK